MIVRSTLAIVKLYPTRPTRRGAVPKRSETHFGKTKNSTFRKWNDETDVSRHILYD